MKGRAIVFTDRLTAACRQVDIPEPGPEDVVIDVEVSWISNGTESSFFRGERIAGDSPYKEGAPWPFPLVPGYQKVGIVTHAGEKVTHVKAGDRVFATVSKVIGMFDPFGGHVSPAVTPAHQVWKLPEHAAPSDYAGLVLTQVGYNCGMRAPVAGGDGAVVLGDGLVANWAAQTLVHRGARVLALGRHDDRLRTFTTGIAAVNTKTDQTPLEQAVRAFEPNGVSIIVDTVGDMASVMAMLPAFRHEGHIVSAGFYGNEGLIDIQKLRAQEITLHAPAGWTKKRMDETLRGVSEGWLQTGRLITHRFPAERAQEAWHLITEKQEPFLGIALDWK